MNDLEPETLRTHTTRAKQGRRGNVLKDLLFLIRRHIGHVKMANPIEHTRERDTRNPCRSRWRALTNIPDVRENLLRNINVIGKRAVHGGSKNVGSDLIALLDHKGNESRDARVKGDPLLSNDTELIITATICNLGVIVRELLNDLPSVETREGASQPGTLFCEAIQHHTFAKRNGIIAVLCHTAWSHNQ